MTNDFSNIGTGSWHWLSDSCLSPGSHPQIICPWCTQRRGQYSWPHEHFTLLKTDVLENVYRATREILAAGSFGKCWVYYSMINALASEPVLFLCSVSNWIYSYTSPEGLGRLLNKVSIWYLTTLLSPMQWFSFKLLHYFNTPCIYAYIP